MQHMMVSLDDPRNIVFVELKVRKNAQERPVVSHCGLPPDPDGDVWPAPQPCSCERRAGQDDEVALDLPNSSTRTSSTKRLNLWISFSGPLGWMGRKTTVFHLQSFFIPDDFFFSNQWLSHSPASNNWVLERSYFNGSAFLKGKQASGNGNDLQ